MDNCGELSHLGSILLAALYGQTVDAPATLTDANAVSRETVLRIDSGVSRETGMRIDTDFGSAELGGHRERHRWM
jgi:hypothetical protein